MISSISANVQSFKAVDLAAGFNVVLAERTVEEEDGQVAERKSTNGSGKTLLLEICQFCLGADVSRSPLADDHLAGWTFRITLHINDRAFGVARSNQQSGRVLVTGDFNGWPIAPRVDPDTEERYFPVDDWTAALGAILYELELDSEETKFRPTFRTLSSYAIRRGLDAYGDPFSYFRGQRAWQRHVANAYLLGLDWTIYQRAEALRRKEEGLKVAAASVSAALETGGLGDFRGIGDLEARRINLEREVRNVATQLETFRVHPQYNQFEERATNLTTEIHDRIADSMADRQTLEFYQQTIGEEAAAGPEEVDAMYEEAGLHFPEQVARNLEEARQFHDRLISNRRAYLGAEIARLERRGEERRGEVERLGEERARVLSFLEEHGALEEFTRLQLLHSREIEELGRLSGQIEQLRSYEENLAAVRIELEQLRLEARADLDRRRPSWGRVVELFGQFTAELYEEPGQLIVDVASNGGLKLGVEIERAASQGVQEMMVFCYDLAVSTSLRERGIGSGMLFHDSTIFDGVDPRQKATALRMAARQAEECGFQYLACQNVGDVPWDDLGDWDLRSYVRRELTDVGDGGLLGIRY